MMGRASRVELVSEQPSKTITRLMSATANNDGTCVVLAIALCFPSEQQALVRALAAGCHSLLFPLTHCESV